MSVWRIHNSAIEPTGKWSCLVCPRFDRGVDGGGWDGDSVFGSVGDGTTTKTKYIE